MRRSLKMMLIYANKMQKKMSENEGDLFSKRLSCFMHFDGVSEQLSKVTHLRLQKFIEIRHKWKDLSCEQAEIAGRSYELFDDESVKLFLEDNCENFDLEWYYHTKCYKKFCDEEKLRRQQKKENEAKTRAETASSTSETCALENEELPRKITRNAVQTETTTSWPQRNKYVLPERCILCEKDSSWFTKDPVCQLGLFFHVFLKNYKVCFDSMLL